MIVTAPFAGELDVAEASADGCASGVRSDFNGDGRSDTVVGDPLATVGSATEAGRIVVLYGDADGLVGEGARDVLWQGEENVAGVAEAGDKFGSALAAGDIDCDGYTDLVVGTPDEDISGHVDSGYVQVVWGGSSGLGISRASQQYTQTSFGQAIGDGDQLGFAVDVVEDNGDGGTPAPDAYTLAIGVPGFNDGGNDDAGAVGVLSALDGGNTYHWLTQSSPGIVGVSEPGDRFGAAVSCNYLRAGGSIDCAVGAPTEDIGTKVDAGGVTLIQDFYDPGDETSVGLDQDASGVPDKAEAGDFYGRSLDTVKVGGTARLAVGVPGEDVGSVRNAGLVQLFSGNTHTLGASTALTQNTAGVGDSAQDGDVFGDQVSWIAPGLGDSKTRLAVSATKEDTTAGEEAGMVQVFPMGDLGAEKTWTQDSAGVPGAGGAGDRFGATLAMVAGVTERVLLVGVPDDVADGFGIVDVIPFGGGTPRAWSPGGGGISSVGAVRFGGSLVSVSGGAT